MPTIKTYQDLAQHHPTPAEQQLIDDSREGRPCILNGGVRPEVATPDCTIRANILRYLILGGCPDHNVDGRGVRLEGAHVTGILDLDYETTRGATRLLNCSFDDMIFANEAQIVSLILSGSALEGLKMQGATIGGNALLRGVHVRGMVSFAGANIGGRLEIVDSLIEGKRGRAFYGQSIRVDGGVLLQDTEMRDMIWLTKATLGGFYCEGLVLTASNGVALQATNLTVQGNVSFAARNVDSDSGPKVSDGARFTGEVILSGAVIHGRLDLKKAQFNNEDGHAFNGQRMRVTQDMIWEQTVVHAGTVSLNGAHVVELADNPAHWPQTPDGLVLFGFTYDRIKGKVSVSKDRRAWLENGSHFDAKFFPQPYSQYAKFLRDVGHDADARVILEEREAFLRAERRRRSVDPREVTGLNDLQLVRAKLWAWWDRLFLDPAFRLVIGYGHAPFRALGVLILLIVLCALPSFMAYHAGDFAPNSAVVQASDGWRDAQDAANPAKAWSAATAKGRDWETFSAGAYAVDVVIPIIEFGQTDAWAPSTSRGPWGYHLWWARWVFTVLGWIITALGAAAITGIIRRE
ncbi:hypothetical protein [Tateyamaria sp. SN3-11]|uniref:hypothetical protein n=1 Tax=Tateyamaria sp. SN3-11 TaxID=3092147 RepID=UPI0039ECA5D3